MLLILAINFFLFRRLRRYLRYLQQDDYDAVRFLKWVFKTLAFDKRGSILALAGLIFPSILAIGYLILALFEKNPEHYGKKPLIRTKRAARILWTAFLLLALLSLTLPPIILCQLPPFMLAFAVILLSFDEKKRQKKLLRRAKLRFLEVNPQVIGITGSYGKTSTKHLLSKLLNLTLGTTFHPEKGVNTPMGITREIREKLQPKTQYAVIEMAAYGPGSISRLCNLTPPHGAIITSIGLAHLERFGSQETIRKTKSELAAAVPQDGFLILNGDDPNCRQIGKDHPKKTMIYYGFNDDLGPLDLKLLLEGTKLQLEWKGKRYTSEMPVMGKPLLANAGASFAAACHLGACPELAASALPHLGSVENRLTVEKAGEITYLHDAYNSNPSGFSAAIEVLQKTPGKRKILMTPGMVELGGLQYAENERVASHAQVDLALIVGETNREPLTKGLLNHVPKESIHQFNTRDEAFHFLKSICESGDVILIENDLPDLYEAKEAF